MLELLAKPVAEKVQFSVKKRASDFFARCGNKPKLAVVLVGEDPASVIYTRRKGEAATQSGFDHETIRLPASSSPDTVKARIARLNADPAVHGILIQRPLPKSFIEEEVVYWVDPKKDVDAFHPENTGRLNLGLPTFAPCTPAGVMELLAYYEIPTRGKVACVIGRSSIVGKPMAALLLQADTTVLHCHSKTPDLAALCRQADIVVAAIGKPEFIRAEHVRDGATVIDVGINRLETGRLVGDVAYAEVSKKAVAITPVPGGVGPMTIAMLLSNTMRAAETLSGTDVAFTGRKGDKVK